MSATYTNVPFFGLGFDMRPAVARAMAMTVRRTEPVHVCVAPQPAETPAPWGYSLMIALSREIRAG